MLLPAPRFEHLLGMLLPEPGILLVLLAPLPALVPEFVLLDTSIGACA